MILKKKKTLVHLPHLKKKAETPSAFAHDSIYILEWNRRAPIIVGDSVRKVFRDYM